MYGVIAILFILGTVAMWIVAGIQMHKYGKAKGVKQFFLMLGIFLFITAILFLTIYAPQIDCSGFLCGLEELLIFLLATYVVMLIMPILMLTVMLSKLKKGVVRKTDDNLIDV
jgi:predicted small integral membrane protein